MYEEREQEKPTSLFLNIDDAFHQKIKKAYSENVAARRAIMKRFSKHRSLVSIEYQAVNEVQNDQQQQYRVHNEIDAYVRLVLLVKFF